MNIQAMMKQAQKLQKDMMDAKGEIDKSIFEGSSSIVTVQMKGTKELVSVNITEIVDIEDKEMLEDMIVVAINDAMKKIDKEVEDKLGKYTQGMPGLF